MSRSGYCDDIDQQDLAMWRGRVTSAMRGKRGQVLLREMLEALDAMPVKELVYHDLVSDSGVCALGAVGRHKKLPEIETIDPEDHASLSKMFNVAECMIQEIEAMNDEGSYELEAASAKRWERMRKWVAKNINQPPATQEAGK